MSTDACRDIWDQSVIEGFDVIQNDYQLHNVVETVGPLFGTEQLTGRA